MSAFLWGEDVLTRQQQYFCLFNSDYFFLEKLFL